MRQIKTIIDRTPEGFDAQVNAAIQEIGSEHLREIRTMMNTPTEPDRLNGGFVAILIYDLLETGQEEGWTVVPHIGVLESGRLCQLSAAGHEILHGIDLKVNAGEIHAMMGPTGLGKSRLAQMLAGREDYHMTSALDIDTLWIVASSINGLRGPERTLIVSTHYQWWMNYNVPDVIHVLFESRIVKSGDKQFALVLEQRGYRWIEAQVKGSEAVRSWGVGLRHACIWGSRR